MDILREDLRKLFSIKAYLEKRPKLLYMLLLLFGIWAAYHIIIIWYYLPQEQPYMNARLEQLNMYIQQILTGGQSQIVSLKDHNPAFYLYASYLGVILGKSEACQVFLFLQLGAAAFILLLYPTLIYRLTHTILPACISPFLLKTFLGRILYEIKTDSYWSMAWIIVLGLPLLGIFFREKQGWPKWAAFVGLCLCMGLANLPRMHSSLGILLLLLLGIVKEFFIPLKKNRSCKLVVSACMLLIITVVSYTLFTAMIPSVYVAATAQKGKIEDFGPWHSMYIGLGWEENKYGIQFSDGCAAEQVQSIDPSAVYCSPEYMDILKNEWFRLWREDPGYMIGTYFRKFGACLKLCWSYPDYAHYNETFCLEVFLLATCILRYICRRKKIWAPWGGLLFGAFFCGVSGMIFPMIAIPQVVYSFGSFAAYGMLYVFGSLAIMQSVIGAAEDFSQKNL